jgi:catechol 2,3-dioxygenase-like lactoylglutathione lyase family enzyme
MSSTQTSNEHATDTPTAATVDLKLEVVVIPVSDVDRSKRFYGSLGWRLDADFAFDNGFRVVQSRRPARGARSNSAPTSRRPRLARPRAST